MTAIVIGMLVGGTVAATAAIWWRRAIDRGALGTVSDSWLAAQRASA